MGNEKEQSEQRRNPRGSHPKSQGKEVPQGDSDNPLCHMSMEAQVEARLRIILWGE
jgi:hypothetical protein